MDAFDINMRRKTHSDKPYHQERCQLDSCGENMQVRLNKFIWRGIYIPPLSDSTSADFLSSEWSLADASLSDDIVHTEVAVLGVICHRTRMKMSRDPGLVQFTFIYLFKKQKHCIMGVKIHQQCWRGSGARFHTGVRLITNAPERHFSVLGRGSFLLRPTHP